MTKLPLAGIRIVELGHSVAAPFAGQVLADLGAIVIKVESPERGDDARAWGPPFWHGASATFQSLNRNKYSAVIDLKDDAQRTRLRDFILTEADVVLQNLRPGLVKRYGLDDSLTEAAPRLVYCNLGAFGSPGPLSDKPGYDPMMQAFSGIMSITGEMNRPPVRVGPSIIDMGAGMWCVIGILSALLRRASTGEGGRVDTSLYETALAWMTVPTAMALAGTEPIRTGSEAAMLAPYKAYQAGDGHYLIVAAGNDNLFRRLCGELARPKWIDDPRFRTNADRVNNRVELNALIDQLMAEDLADSWIARLERAGVPCSRLQTITEVIAHPQTTALGMVQDVPGSPMRFIGLPLRFDGERPAIRKAPPSLGDGTDMILNPPKGDPA
jgi:crotonobetainyl-CoA:carnitine CoA-transferase CaiB-like acyl-CoA transferase